MFAGSLISLQHRSMVGRKLIQRALLESRCRQSEIGRFRQRLACLSSSAKDDADRHRPKAEASRPSSPGFRGKRSGNSNKVNNLQSENSRADMNRIMSDFFAKSPAMSPAMSPRTNSTRDSILETFRSPKSSRQDRPSTFSRFSREKERTKIKPGSLRANSLPNNTGDSKSDGGIASILQNLRRPSNAIKSTSPSSLEKPVDRSRADTSDVSQLRTALFGTPTGKNDAGKPVSTLSDTSSPLSEVIQAMRADKERRRAMEANEDPALRPKWRQSDGSMRRRRLGDAEAQANMWESSNRLESRVRQRQGKPVDSEETGGKLLQLPSYEMNLIEVSLLLRVSTQRLRKVLRSMGELPRGKVEDKDIVVHPEILEYVALDLGIGFEKVDRTIQSDEELLLQRRATAEQSADMYETYAPRPPVVCIMGHVDHGKTTLMDALRRRATEGEGKPQKKVGKAKKNKAAASKKASGGNVAGTEAGGITQVISAFQVPLPDADVGAVTFLDTPGHAAFRSMRQSGSDAADVVVLVVAADDGVSPQTVEIIEFYKSIVTSSGSGISMVVALNKIDKPGVDVERARTMVEGQLLEHGIVTERMGSESDFGPPVQLIPVSGLSGQGLDELIGGLVLQSEVMDLRADANACAEGVVLDARMEKGLGVVADCIIRWGSITKGDIVVSGTQKGKVRFLRDVGGKTIKQGIPSQPVRIVGFEELPKAGDPFICMELEEEADAAVERRLAAIETEAIAKADGPSTAHAELQSAGKHLMSYDWRTRLQQRHGIDDNEDGGPIRIPVILRADADGTLAALRESVVAIGEASSHNIVIDPIQTGIGPALPTDVEMAKESQAAILCFNVNNDVQKEADEASVKVLRSDVIYSILDDARVYFGSYLPAEAKETIHGRAKVGAIFSIGGIDTKVAGLQVLEGNLYRDKIPASKTSSGQATAIFRVLRNGDVIESTIQGMPATSLKHFKEDVTEIGRGKECGLSLANFGDFEEGDEIECWSVSMEHQPL